MLLDLYPLIALVFYSNMSGTMDSEPRKENLLADPIVVACMQDVVE